ncbi:hypothetical protein P171DRAFT_442872 [Karstenula rhodostoma CBS 690.94]|uniref:Uncharacterized protein n=1 Tax=Karstenula rhodostoma CBS 690.94 TaxID=1392251 RepID=A0A9P4PK17_9PLEO|nr:hypothetical protein P171DRAFT_442872 [Karstenula rhodostoma CBS 690.94]
MGFLDTLIDAMLPRKAGRSSGRRRRTQREPDPDQFLPPIFPDVGGPGGPPAAPGPQFGTQMRRNQRTVDGYQTDQPEFFRQGGRRAGPGLPALSANQFGAGRSGQRGSSRRGSQGGRSSRRSEHGGGGMYAPHSASRGGRSQLRPSRREE